MVGTIKIQNLKCGGCANTIVTQLDYLEDITEIEVNVETDEVTFSYNTEKEVELVVNKLTKLGYPPVGANNPLTSKAKSYVSCAIGKMS